MNYYGVWGAHTLDQHTGAKKYLSVRRLTLFIKDTIVCGINWVAFERNEEPLWAEIRLRIGTYMNTLFQQGALAGSTPREAYFVKCDGEATTQNDIDRGVVNIVARLPRSGRVPDPLSKESREAYETPREWTFHGLDA